MTVDELSRIANRLRLDVVETVHLAGDGHPGPCMSIADIIAVLFFEEMKLDPNNPHCSYFKCCLLLIIVAKSDCAFDLKCVCILPYSH